MSAPSERWEPAADPVHRLIHLFDFHAAMTACHRWQPVVLTPDEATSDRADCTPPPADPAAHPPDILSAELLAAHADAAVARFARYGQPAAAGFVHDAAELLTAVTEAYSRQPCPCHPCPDCGGRVAPHHSEFALCVLYALTRRALLRHLALAGHAVPLAVRLRGAELAQLLRAAELPPDPHVALRRAVGRVIVGGPPPAGRPAWDAAGVRAWVDKLAGPPGITVRAAWTITRRERTPAERAAATERASATQPTARRAILKALLTADGPLTGKKLEVRAGYKAGSLRRHTKPLQDAGLIARTTAGYTLTPAGLAEAKTFAPVTYAVTTPPTQ